MPLVLVLALLFSLVGSADARVRWRWPVPGRTVVRHFLLGADRFAAGQHRGVTLAAAPGVVVRAACGGRVTWAGRIGASGPAVAVACGPLSATYTHLGAVAVRRGAWVAPGQRLGGAGAAGFVQLGARVRSRRDGYLDPLRLLGAVPRLPPLGPAPPRVRFRRLPPARPAVPRPVPAPAASAAWWPALGLGLLGGAGLVGAGRSAFSRWGRRRGRVPGGVLRRGRV